MLFTIKLSFFYGISLKKLFSTVDTDDLALKHQGINSHIAEYATMHLKLFMG